MRLEPKQSLLEKFEARSDRYLTVAVTCLELIFALVMVILSVLTLAWLVQPLSLQELQSRLTTVLVTLNENWKAVLLLMVPLFYRTARKLVARITKLPGGVEAIVEDEKAKPETVTDKPNPKPIAESTRA